MDTLRRVISENYTPLTDQEIDDFFNELDRDNDGYITLEELETGLKELHDEYNPKLEKHHIFHPHRRDLEKDAGHAGDGLHNFLCKLMPGCESKVAKQDFISHVKTWGVPSQKQADIKQTDAEDHEQERRIPLRRRVRAYWAVHGPNIVFSTVVVALVIAIGFWQGGIYITNPRARAALGWGVIMAKLAAGAIYPTFVFMLLSMSRHLATFLRSNYHISKFINWDHSQRFHIIMSCAGLVFASLHAIGHLTGSFYFGSRPENQAALGSYLGPGTTPKAYINFVRTLPGWSGIISLGLFWTISLLSLPVIRKRSYEFFQLAHLLMFPLIGFLCAHGTAALLQKPMFGYWIAFPFLLVLLERLWRFALGFKKIPAEGRILTGDDAILIKCKHPSGKPWRYSAGQYILLQVPSVSFFQWHPFTVSRCSGSEIEVHIKIESSGSWTSLVRDLILKSKSDSADFFVGIDGPFGAPAQRFYDYETHAIIIGGGIGITPFAAILNDLEENIREERDPWADRKSRRSRSISRSIRKLSVDGFPSSVSRASTPPPPSAAAIPDSTTLSPLNPTSTSTLTPTIPQPPPLSRRRIDLHWSVRSKNNLLWFSSLLNRSTQLAQDPRLAPHLALNIHTHITAPRKKISNHIFRYLLDGYRTEQAPYSALTGLRQRSSFGRPDFEKILERHFEDVQRQMQAERGVGREVKVGVFYCGTPVVGEILSDTCHQLTVKARGLGLRIRYDFLMEVFG